MARLIAHTDTSVLASGCPRYMRYGEPDSWTLRCSPCGNRKTDPGRSLYSTGNMATTASAFRLLRLADSVGRVGQARDWLWLLTFCSWPSRADTHGRLEEQRFRHLGSRMATTWHSYLDGHVRLRLMRWPASQSAGCYPSGLVTLLIRRAPTTKRCTLCRRLEMQMPW